VEDVTALIQAAEKVGLFARTEAGLLKCPQLDEWLAPVFEKRNRSRNTPASPKLSQPATETGVSVTVIPPVKNSREQNSKVNTSNDVAPPLSDDLKARLAALTDTSGEVRWNASILNKPDYFARIARKLAGADTDLEHYRRAALIVAEADDSHRTIKGWESWVANYFTNQLQRGPLLTVAAATLDLSQPTPRHLLPAEGSDCTGRHIVLQNTGDANMNRMAAASYAGHFPNATIHHTR
jgi:hypothetical protein